MQNRYVADVGDFGKYGLLRYIARANLILGVNWYLVPDENNNDDGKHITYLEKDDYRQCDEELYNILKEIVAENKRNIDCVQQSGILPKNTIFHKEILDYHKEPNWIYRSELRKKWHENSTILGLKFRRGTIRDYIFILQPQHVNTAKDCCNSLLDSKWKEHFSKLNI